MKGLQTTQDSFSLLQLELFSWKKPWVPSYLVKNNSSVNSSEPMGEIIAPRLCPGVPGPKKRVFQSLTGMWAFKSSE